MNVMWKSLAVPAGLLGFVVASSLGAQQCGGPATVGTGVCIACHDGRSATDQLDFLVSQHAGIECEACHGPGYVHVRNGGRGGRFIKNPAKESFANAYRLCTACHAEQVAGFLASGHGQKQAATCHDCHDVHAPGGARRNPNNNEMCLTCHAPFGFSDSAAIEAHTMYHPNDPGGTGASRCISCHMPPLDAILQADGPHDHTLATIPPIRSNEAAQAGAVPTPPNSCSGIAGCHDGSVPGAPIFDVDNFTFNGILQSLYEQVGQMP